MQHSYVPVHLFQFTISTLALCHVVTAFLFQDQCATPSPCSCSSSDIDCSWKHLSKFPQFSEPTLYSGSSHNPDSLRLLFSFNQFTVIPSGVFSNFSSLNETSIKMYFIGNNIWDIESNAFDGIKNNIVSLDLSFNNLTHLPVGLGELTALKTLDISQNPIGFLDRPVLSKLGHSLNILIMDAEHLYSLTDELYPLHNLTKLIMSYIPFSSLSSNVFDGLQSLTELEMSYAMLEKIPVAICSLHSAWKITIKNSAGLRDYDTSVLTKCDMPVKSLKTLVLSNNSLTMFPNVFSSFPNMEHLLLDHNNISFINISYSMYNTTLKQLDLSYNKLTSVPSAVNLFDRLNELKLDGNMIVSIGDNDLFRLHGLTDFGVSYNPLTHVSPNVFRNIPYLYNLEFGHTKLGKIPNAVLLLRGTLYLVMDGTPVECSCSAWAHLKHWNISYIYMSGNCKSGLQLRYYYKNRFPNCS